jgi:hypothetical protein
MPTTRSGTTRRVRHALTSNQRLHPTASRRLKRGPLGGVSVVREMVTFNSLRRGSYLEQRFFFFFFSLLSSLGEVGWRG